MFDNIMKKLEEECCMEKYILDKVNEWLGEEYDEKTKAEIKKLLDENNEEELIDRFYKDLEFGTGGLRGKIGAGTNRMNIYNIRKATQGVANCIHKYFKNSPSAIVTYDCRNFSREFAMETASVLAGNGIKVYITKDMRPTPYLSFAIRELKTSAGIIITASHNPPEYNGYKVSWNDGGQVVPPIDKEIIAEVGKISSLSQIKKMDFEEGLKKGLICYVPEELDEKFINVALSQILNKDVIEKQKENIKIAYTPLHGVGITVIPELMRKLGIKNFFMVKEQAKPDGNFPTVRFPNPEEDEAMKMVLELAKEKDADIAIATDPDADRVRFAAKTKNGNYRLFSGNQILTMLIYYKLFTLKNKGMDFSNKFIIKTIVTTDIIKRIAKEFGVKLYEVLTGFKWIAAKIKEKEEKGEEYLIGGEESIGYLVGPYCRDKDSVGAIALITELACYLKENDKTFMDFLEEIYSKFDFYLESLVSIVREGKEGEEKIKSFMSAMKSKPLAKLGKRNLVKVMDVEDGIIYEYPSKNVIEKLNLPKSKVLGFFYDDGSKIMLRPSGTEPKVKFYLSVNLKCDDNIEKIEKKGGDKLKKLQEDFVKIVKKLL